MKRLDITDVLVVIAIILTALVVWVTVKITGGMF